MNQLYFVSLPSKVHDAMRDEKWMKAMIVEINALEKNCTWELATREEDNWLWVGVYCETQFGWFGGQVQGKISG